MFPAVLRPRDPAPTPRHLVDEAPAHGPFGKGARSQFEEPHSPSTERGLAPGAGFAGTGPSGVGARARVLDCRPYLDYAAPGGARGVDRAVGSRSGGSCRRPSFGGLGGADDPFVADVLGPGAYGGGRRGGGGYGVAVVGRLVPVRYDVGVVGVVLGVCPGVQPCRHRSAVAAVAVRARDSVGWRGPGRLARRRRGRGTLDSAWLRMHRGRGGIRGRDA